MKLLSDHPRHKRSTIKRARRASSEAAEVVRKVAAFFTKERSTGRSIHLRSVNKRLCEATGFSHATVSKILGCSLDNKQNEQLPTFPTFKSFETRRRSSVVPVAYVRHIRFALNSLYRRRETPTTDSIMQELIDCKVPWNWSRTTLYKFMKRNGFSFKRKSFHEEIRVNKRIIAQRESFISKLRLFRNTEKRTVFYLDETWLNKNMSPIRGYWYDDNNVGGFPVQSGVGERAIVAHIGSSRTGFVDGCLLMFKSSDRKSAFHNYGDVDDECDRYHGDMNSSIFLHWMQSIVIPKLPSGSVIVMDRASYHLKFSNVWYPPKSSFTRYQLITYVLQRGYRFGIQGSGKNTTLEHCLPRQELNELLHISEETIANTDKLLAVHKVTKKRIFEIAQEMKKKVKYEIESLCEDKGIRVLLLPVHHPELNPIEKTWARMKQSVRKRNVTFSLNACLKYAQEAFSSVTATDWKSIEAKCIAMESVYMHDHDDHVRI